MACIMVGVISDTHGLLRPEALAAVAGTAHIIHAGDIEDGEALAVLRRLAPVTAVRGNCDRGPWASELPVQTVVMIEGVHIAVVHDLYKLTLDAKAAGLAADSFKPQEYAVLFAAAGIVLAGRDAAEPGESSDPRRENQISPSIYRRFAAV